MTYYTRYVLTEPTEITLSEMEAALQQADAGYCIDGDLLVLGDEEYGQIDIQKKGDALFNGDLETLQRYANKKRNDVSLLTTLKEAQSMVTVQAIWSRDPEETLAIIEPLFRWLLENRRGLFVAEGGEFFNKNGPIE